MCEIPTLTELPSGVTSKRQEEKRPQGRPRKDPVVKLTAKEPMPAFSTLLPAPLREALIKAAKEPNSMDRRRAIDAVYQAGALHYPKYFKIA